MNIQELLDQLHSDLILRKYSVPGCFCAKHPKSLLVKDYICPECEDDVVQLTTGCRFGSSESKCDCCSVEK